MPVKTSSKMTGRPVQFLSEDLETDEDGGSFESMRSGFDRTISTRVC